MTLIVSTHMITRFVMKYGKFTLKSTKKRDLFQHFSNGMIISFLLQILGKKLSKLRACLKSVIRMLCCYKYSKNPQKIFEILLNIPEIFCGFLENFSTKIIRSKILNRLLEVGRC